MKPPEIIYLQNPDEDDPEFWSESTWCSDKINEHDVKYMLASPLLVAAPDLLEALHEARIYLLCLPFDQGNETLMRVDAAIAKAEPKS